MYKLKTKILVGSVLLSIHRDGQTCTSEDICCQTTNTIYIILEPCVDMMAENG